MKKTNISEITTHIRYFEKKFVLSIDAKIDDCYHTIKFRIEANWEDKVFIFQESYKIEEEYLKLFLDCIEKHKKEILNFINNVDNAERVVNDSSWHKINV